ncbi:MAG: hypothetical protein WEA58_01715 [Balneolaceae bacterium]
MVHKILNKTTTVLFILTASFFLVQCGDSPDNTSEVYDDNTNTEMQAEGEFEEERDELVSDLEDLQEDLDQRIEDLNSRIEEDGDQADESLIATRNEVQNNRTELEQTLQEVENTSEENWASVRSESRDFYDRVSSQLEEWANRIDDEVDN